MTPQISTNFIPHMERRPNDARMARRAASSPAWARTTRVETQFPPADTNVAYMTMMIIVKAKNLVSFPVC